MPKVLVTGMSGTGKSAALEMLGERGHRVVDTDTGQWSALLSAPADVLLARIAARTSNPYGKDSGERALILRHLDEVEPLLRATATIEIDATAPLSHVVRQLEDLT